MAWTKPDVDESEWERLLNCHKIGKLIRLRCPRVFGWYRKTIFPKNGISQTDTSIGSIDDAGEVYLNGLYRKSVRFTNFISSEMYY